MTKVLQDQDRYMEAFRGMLKTLSREDLQDLQHRLWDNRRDAQDKVLNKKRNEWNSENQRRHYVNS